MTARCLSPAAVSRLADEMDTLADRVWLVSEELLAKATELKSQAREIRMALAEEQEADELRQIVGPTLMVKRSA